MFTKTMIATLFIAGAAANAGTIDFSSPDLSAWTQDRFTPAVFETAMFDGDSRLRQGVRSQDNLANRTGGQNIGFYNYQGMKHDVGTPNGSSVSIDLFVDSTWSSGTRAGLWTTMSNGNLTFPIVEYVVDGDVGGSAFTGFRWWQSGIGWTSLAFDASNTDAWYTLGIELTASDILFTINNTQVATTNNLGAHMIDNVILNVHNEGLAGEYDVYWDNFAINVVPVPTAALAGMAMLGGIAGVRTVRRRK